MVSSYRLRNRSACRPRRSGRLSGRAQCELEHIDTCPPARPHWGNSSGEWLRVRWLNCRGRTKGEHMANVAPDTHEALSGISVGDLDILDAAIGLREIGREVTGLDARTYALVKIAALIA